MTEVGEGVAVNPPKGGPKGAVNPVITPAKLVLAVLKVAKDSGGKEGPYTQPKRRPVKLKTDRAFDGTGTFKCGKPALVKFYSAAVGGNEIKIDGTDNVFKPKVKPKWATGAVSLAGGVTVYAEAVAPSSAMDDVTLELSLSGGSGTNGADAKATATAVEVTLDVCGCRPAAGGDPAALSKDEKIAEGRNLLVQDEAGRFLRSQLVIQQVKPAAFNGALVVKATGNVTAFKSEKWTKGEKSALPYRIPDASKIPASGDKTLWAGGTSASKSMRDSEFVIAIEKVEEVADRVKATAVEIKLDVCHSRLKAGGDPAPMTVEDKVKVGRFLHEQDASGHHGRALLVVHKVKPESFKGALKLSGENAAKVEVFPNERPQAGEAATAVPHDLEYDPAAAGKKNEKKMLWVQGKSGGASGALRDVKLSLHLKEDPPTNADAVHFTVCKLTELKADIPCTPANVTRAGNAPARHTYERSGASADHWDFDDATNQALVLVENSVPPANPIKLSVKVKPAGVPVLWDTPRDRRPAPNGDNAKVAGLSGQPTITQDGADPLKATLLANGVGTFRIAPFVDNGGSRRFHPEVDLDPYLTMNLVLVRVRSKRNDSVKGTNAVTVPAAPTSATGCGVESGGWIPATAAAYSKATVTIIGGGDDGRRGLDRVFAGWCQQIEETGSSASAPKGLDIYARYQFNPPAPAAPPAGPPPPPPAPVFHRAFFIFTRSAAAGTVFAPAGPAPAVEPCPVLDVTPAGADGTGGDSCTGQWGGHGPYTAIAPVNKPIGQEWTVDTLDSPSVGLGAAHDGGLPGSMIEFRFRIDFRVDLVFWTNMMAWAAPTGDPADRLYSSVQTNRWSVSFAINFNPATGMPVGAVPPVTLALAKDGNRAATPVEGMSLETRSPTALDLFSVDARA